MVTPSKIVGKAGCNATVKCLSADIKDVMCHTILCTYVLIMKFIPFRHYNVQEMMYIETLYGHQFGVTGIDCCRKERPISVGRDRTARVWKLSEDTHLIFRGGAKIASPECISSIKDDWFLTGHEDGHIGLWMTDKKKAVSNFEFAHGKSHGSVGRSISSITSLKGSDIAASGSNDGSIKLWKVRKDLRGPA